MKELNLREDIEDIVNKCMVKSTPRAKDSSASDIWAATDKIYIPFNTTIEVWCEFSDPVDDVDTSFVGVGGAAGESRFRANSRESGGGVDMIASLTIVCTPFGQSAKLEITNSHATCDIYLVDTSGDAYLYIGGKSIPEQDVTIGKYEGSASIALYGEHGLEIDNKYITNQAYADGLAEYIVQKNKDPVQRIEKLDIMAQPHLQLMDRITVTASYLGVNNDFDIKRLGWSLTEMDADVYESDVGNWLQLSHGTYGKLDNNKLAF